MERRPPGYSEAPHTRVAEAEKRLGERDEEGGRKEEGGSGPAASWGGPYKREGWTTSTHQPTGRGQVSW